MDPRLSQRSLWTPLLALAGAATAISITGTESVWAMAAFFALSGTGALLARPTVRPEVLPCLLAVLLCGAALSALLPGTWLAPVGWRQEFPASDDVVLASSIAVMPAHVWFWWSLLAGTCLVGVVLLASPLEGRRFAVFLHFVAAFVAAYAVLSMVDVQTAWNYPFSDGAPFGFLPNRNHTATLLVVGAIIAFGLMQWELTHGHRGAAALAALWGAPSLAALLFFSISRAGVLLLVVGFVLWLVGAPLTAANRRRIFVAVVALAVALVALFSLGGSEVQGRLVKLWAEVMAVEQGSDEPSNVDFRQPIFRDAGMMIAASPWVGAGLGHFEDVFRHYRHASVRGVGLLHPESSWLMLAAEAGLPAVAVLLMLAGWFFVRCLRARGAEDGLLRWTVASAVGVAVLHGVIDVPWHRPASGWFLFVVAMASVPSSGLVPRRPWLLRSGQIVAGLILLAGAGYFAWQNTTDRPPLGYRWAAYEAELKALGDARKHDDGEFVAREAVRDFPLNPRAHLWHMGFLRTFLGTEELMQQSARLALHVDPVQPSIAEGVAVAWATIDPVREAEARAEAVRRAARIDRTEGRPDLPTAGEQVRRALEAAKDRPDVQAMVLEKLPEDPVLAAYWVRSAPPELVSEWAGRLPQAEAWLDGLPVDLRGMVLDRWVGLPDASVAVAYMEARSLPAPGPYWRTLAKFYAGAGDKPRAVDVVARATGISLEGGGRSLNDFGREIAALEAQGNDVAVRRLLREAVSAKQADADRLSVAMAAYASAGDWDTAWRAASRLATEAKLPQ